MYETKSSVADEESGCIKHMSLDVSQPASKSKGVCGVMMI